MKILGIDPGSSLTGFGILEDGKFVEYGCIRTENKLTSLFYQTKEIIEKHKPNAMAIEKLFFSQNTKTALRVGEARGVLLLCAAFAELTIAEYTPLEVKMAVTGYGKADKQQVQQMVKSLLGLKEIPKPDDAADALAVAICHENSYRIKEMIK
ncbi:MAG: ruvC [Candidatus Saganbacteria bacterium]|uniref:Crossover junction endodeoxyribonuclease RuvC n=1 Tax=Candidatus Saganbacteria bacterium TaxID=2575572 RepID=A0A833L1Z1_UNCSA|nr:MAG: ruvC [Candidatus Saganbacteria bacterium]